VPEDVPALVAPADAASSGGGVLLLNGEEGAGGADGGLGGIPCDAEGVSGELQLLCPPAAALPDMVTPCFVISRTALRNAMRGAQAAVERACAKAAEGRPVCSAITLARSSTVS
jgi:hypothetical protein